MQFVQTQARTAKERKEVEQVKYYNDPEHSLTDEEKASMYPASKFIIDQIRDRVEYAKKKKWSSRSLDFLIEQIRAWEKGQQDIRNRRIEKEIEKGDQNRLEDYSGA